MSRHYFRPHSSPHYAMMCANCEQPVAVLTVKGRVYMQLSVDGDRIDAGFVKLAVNFGLMGSIEDEDCFCLECSADGTDWIPYVDPAEYESETARRDDR